MRTIKTRNHILFIVIAIVFSFGIIISCEDNGTRTDENWLGVSGYITDSVTNLPIDSAVIRMTTLDSSDSSNIWYSDSTGHYGVMTAGWGPSFKLVVDKLGYQTQQINLMNINDHIDNLDFELVLSE